MSLRQHLMDDVCRFHTGQPLVETLKSEHQLLVIDAQAVQNRCVQVADMNRIVDDVVAVVVGLTVLNSALDAPRLRMIGSGSGTIAQLIERRLATLVVTTSDGQSYIVVGSLSKQQNIRPVGTADTEELSDRSIPVPLRMASLLRSWLQRDFGCSIDGLKVHLHFHNAFAQQILQAQLAMNVECNVKHDASLIERSSYASRVFVRRCFGSRRSHVRIMSPRFLKTVRK